MVLEHLVDARRAASPVRRATQRRPDAPCPARSASSRFSKHGELLEHGRLLELAADAGLGDLRLGQAAAGRCVGRRTPCPASGRVLPVITSIIVRLAGAVRADDAAQLAGLDVQRQVVQRLEAVEADGDAFEVEDRAVQRIGRGGHRRMARPCERSSAPGRVQRVTAASARRRSRQQADEAARQEQRHEHEQRAERIQPDLRQRAGEVGLGVVDEHRAGDRAVQRAAAADRHPDHDLDRVDRRELARVDDADLRHVQRAGDAGEHRRERRRPTACSDSTR